MSPEQIDALNIALLELTKQIKKDTTDRQRSSQSDAPAGPSAGPTRENFTRMADAASSYASAMERIDEQLKKQEDALKDQLDILEDRQALQQLHEKGMVNEIDDIEEGLKKRKKGNQEEINALFRKKSIQGDLSKVEQETLENLVRANKVIERNLDFAKMTLEQKDEALRQDEKAARLAKARNKTEKERLQSAKESGAVVDDTLDSLAASLKLKPDPKRGLAGFLRTIVTDSDARQTALESFKQKITDFKQLVTPVNLLGVAFEFTANALGSLVTLGFKGLIRILQAVAEAIVGSIMLFDKLGADIAKATGHGKDFAQQYMDVAKSLDATGTNMKEQVEKIVELGGALRGVGGMSIETSGDFANLAITSERLGMATEDLTETIKLQMVGFGKSSQEVKQSIQNLNAAASTMGMNFSDLSKQFVSTQGSFAAFGHNSQKIFLRTASTARQLGVEMSDIIQLGDKFKTFDSAANSVADLNYIMGGQFLDTMEMMQLRATEGPEGVSKRIKENFDSMGQSFADLSFHKQEALAEAAGMTMDKARNFFMGKVDEDETTAVEKATQSFNAFAKRGKETFTLMEKIGKLALKVGMQIASAFGFDKFATGEAGDLLDKFEKFADKELIGKIVPFIQDDLAPALKNLGKLLSNLVNSRLMGGDPTENRVKSQLSFLKRELGEDQYQKLLTEDAQSTEVGASDQQERISAQVKMIKESNLSLSKQSELLKKIMNLEKEISEDDFEAGTTATGTERKFQRFVEQGNFNPTGVTARKDYKTSLAIRTFGQPLQDEAPIQSSGKPLPEGAKGGSILSGGAMMVGEKGPEIVVLPTGATVVPNDAFARTGSPFPMDKSSPDKQKDVKVSVNIQVDDRKLRDLFSTTVEQVLVGA